MKTRHPRDLTYLNGLQLGDISLTLLPKSVLAGSDIPNSLTRAGRVPAAPNLPPDPSKKWWCHEKFDGTFVCNQDGNASPFDNHLTGPFDTQDGCGQCSVPSPRWWCHVKNDLLTFICNNNSQIETDDFLKTGPFDSELHCGDCSPKGPLQTFPPPIPINIPPVETLPPTGVSPNPTFPAPAPFPQWLPPGKSLPPQPPGPFPIKNVDYKFVGAVSVAGINNPNLAQVAVICKFWRYTGQMYTAQTDPVGLTNISTGVAGFNGSFTAFLYRQPGNFSLIGAKVLPIGPFIATQFGYINWAGASFQPYTNPGDSVGLWTIPMTLSLWVYNPAINGR